MSATPLTPTSPKTASIRISSAPVVTITFTPVTPASLHSPPLTPSPTVVISKPIPVPEVPDEHVSLPTFNFPYKPHSLHRPLKRHLHLVHPSTPPRMLSFIATRLLSRDRPFGHTGSWTPLWADGGCLDLSAAGVGREAGKGCCQREGGKGREVDRQVEGMYAVARQSWGLLEAKSQGVL